MTTEQIQHFNTLDVIATAMNVYHARDNRHHIGFGVDDLKLHALILSELSNPSQEMGRTNSQIVIDYLKCCLTADILAGRNVSPSRKKSVAKLDNVETARSDIVKIAYAVIEYAKQQLLSHTREIVSQYAHISKPIGKINEQISVEVTVIAVRWLPDFECFNVLGHDSNGNFITFFTKHEKLTQSQTISGKV